MAEGLRLLMVSHFYESHGGGIERVAGHLARALADTGHRVCLAASAADPPPVDPRIDALPLACLDPAERLTGLPMPIPGPRALAALVRAVRGADAVIVHDALYLTSIIALVAARWHRRPVVLIQHIAALEFASASMRALMRLATALVTRPMLRAADRVVFISARVRDAFAGMGLRRAPLLVFNGVDTALFNRAASPDEAARLRRDLALPAAGPLVAFVGRFVPKKGLAVLRECAARRPGLTLVLAGSGPIDPARWNLANVCVAGPLDPPQVAALLRSADVLLLPSVGEGYPLVIQEAMACGLPAICGEDSAEADPGARRFLRPVRIDPADPAGTAERILPLLDRALDSSLRPAMADYAVATYSWAAMARQIADALAAR
ncbi:glycosyltransferase family 4 protein [Novosphingobium bradum]|uniref:Glycosyltransferase family 4 protein n=1 Tax=Novosphingobium bradum TaxID=1737444 RepID=A0ABV7IN23_9SPHN